MRITIALASSLLSISALALGGCGGVDEGVTPVEGAADPGTGGGAVSSNSATAGVGGAGETSASSGAGGEEVAYPAPHPGMPEIPNHGGVVLHDPVITTVTFPGETLTEYLQAFDDTIGGTPWWATVNTEYGVGPATAGAHVTIAEAPPASLTDNEVKTWLADRIGDGTLAPATDQTIYVLYYPASTSISLGTEKSCEAFGGYHSFTNVTVDSKKIPIAYAVIPRCGGGAGGLTTTVSHELTEASTDPHPAYGSLTYSLITKNAWALAGGENADMCSFGASTTEGDYEVTRSWSNKNAKIGQNPCVPVAEDPDGLPYFNAGVVNELVKVAPGETFTSEVDCYSFGALPNEMTLEGKAFSGDILTFEFDKATCKNGDVVTMTVHVSPSAQKGTDYHYSLRSTVSENSAHSWRGLVAVQ